MKTPKVKKVYVVIPEAIKLLVERLANKFRWTIAFIVGVQSRLLANAI